MYAFSRVHPIGRAMHAKAVVNLPFDQCGWLGIQPNFEQRCTFRV